MNKLNKGVSLNELKKYWFIVNFSTMPIHNIQDLSQ